MSQGKALFPVLIALSTGHLINDTIQSLLPAIYPIIKQVYQLDFSQIGILTLTFQLAACIFQPIVGHINDKNPMPFSIVTGMAFSLIGLLTLAYAGSYEALLIGATFVGLGSSIFHPEATRMARRASGGQLGMAQAIFVVGGQTAYSASFNSFYTFYLIDKFEVTMQTSQYMLFLLLLASALGSLVGGWLGDKFGRTFIIWFSIVGALPFTMLLPHVGLVWTGVLTVIINLIMSTALSSIIVYAMELMPNRTGMIGGLFYGLAFGFGGLAAAALGVLADHTSIDTVYHLCAYLPLLGLFAFMLPKVDRPAKA